VRYGRLGASTFVLVAAAVTLWVTLPLGVFPAVVISALVVFAGGILAMSYVEIVRLITEMLLPQ